MLEPVELTRPECEALLRSGVVARVAVSSPRGPHILPVNYAVVDDLVVVRTSAYSLLGTHAPGATVAVEVDSLDHERQRGWSVLVRGRAEVVSDPGRLETIRCTWPPRPWAAGQRVLHVAVPLDEVTGRRLGHGWDPVRESAYRRVV